jgi:DNA-binding CsgD family transcriptional regulator
MDNIAALIDQIYEAAVIPENWMRVLDGMAEISDAEGTLLFANTPDNVQWICSPAIRPFIESWVNSKWVVHNGRGERLVPIREPRFLTDFDAFTLEEIEREPFYNEFLRPIGYGWCVGTTIHSPCGDSLVFSIEKKYHKGPVDRAKALLLDNLRPHLARSALLSARIGLERARATVDTLQAIGFPAAVLSHNGRAIVANKRFATCEPAISIAAKDEVIFSNAALQAIFKDAFAALRLNSRGSLGRSIPLPARGDHPAMIAHLVPLRRSALDIFSGAFALIYVTLVVQQSAPQPALLEALFDLTPAEAKVASLLVQGQSVAEIAKAQDIKQNSVRTQLKAVFAKTGVHRQAELVSLLAMQSHGGGEQ